MAVSALVPPSGRTVRPGAHWNYMLPAHRLVQQKVALVPEGRRVFGTLTVRETLSLEP